MPVVKRFRALGTPRQVERGSFPEKDVVEVKPESKIVKRFDSKQGARKVRKDKKHHFQLRVGYDLWDKVDQLSLDCGGQHKGASLNVICCKLLGYALLDEALVKKILGDFPGNDRYVLVRSWRIG